MINRELLMNAYSSATHDRQKNEVCLSFIYSKYSFSWFDIETMREQMKMWRKYAKQGVIQILPYNNKEVKDDVGNTWYILTVQNYKNDKLDESNPMCVFNLYVFGIMVSGYSYAFRKKENRDMVFSYVMKDVVFKL